MTTIAVIGLGVMGGPMAANLVRAGYDVVGYNRSLEKVDALVRNWGRGAASVAEAVKDAQIVLPDSPDVEEVVACGHTQWPPGSRRLVFTYVRRVTTLAAASGSTGAGGSDVTLVTPYFYSP